MRICIGIEPGETIGQAQRLRDDLYDAEVLPEGMAVDIAAYLVDDGPITMTVP